MTKHRSRPGAELFGVTPQTSRDLRSEARKGSSWSILQQGGSRLTTVVVFVVLARLLGPEEFGIVAIATVVIALLQIVVAAGFGQALVQREDLRPGHADTVFWTSLATATVLAGALAASASLIAHGFREPQLAPVLQVLSIALVLSALGAAQVALLRRNFMFRSLAMRSVAGNVAGGAAGVATALLGGGVWALVVQYLVLTLANTVLLWVATGWRPGFEASWSCFRDLFAFSRNTFGNSVLGFANQRGDDFLIGAWLGSAVLGVYSVGYRLLTVMQDLVNQTIMTVSLPIFSRLQNEPERLGRAYREALRIGSAVSFPAYLFFVVAAPDVIHVLFGPKWAAAGPVMQILAVFGAIQTTMAVSDNCLIASGRPHYSFRIRLVMTILQVSLMAAAVPYGIEWVAVALVVRACVGAPLPAWLLRRAGITTFRAFFGSMITPMIATGAMLGALAVLSSVLDAIPPAVRLGGLVVTGPFVYVGVLALVDRRLLRDLRRFGGSRRSAPKSGGGPDEPETTPIPTAREVS